MQSKVCTKRHNGNRQQRCDRRARAQTTCACAKGPNADDRRGAISEAISGRSERRRPDTSPSMTPRAAECQARLYRRYCKRSVPAACTDYRRQYRSSPSGGQKGSAVRRRSCTCGKMQNALSLAVAPGGVRLRAVALFSAPTEIRHQRGQAPICAGARGACGSAAEILDTTHLLRSIRHVRVEAALGHHRAQSSAGTGTGSSQFSRRSSSFRGTHQSLMVRWWKDSPS